MLNRPRPEAECDREAREDQRGGREEGLADRTEGLDHQCLVAARDRRRRSGPDRPASRRTGPRRRRAPAAPRAGAPRSGSVRIIPRTSASEKMMIKAPTSRPVKTARTGISRLPRNALTRAPNVTRSPGPSPAGAGSKPGKSRSGPSPVSSCVEGRTWGLVMPSPPAPAPATAVAAAARRHGRDDGIGRDQPGLGAAHQQARAAAGVAAAPIEDVDDPALVHDRDPVAEAR